MSTSLSGFSNKKNSLQTAGFLGRAERKGFELLKKAAWISKGSAHHSGSRGSTNAWRAAGLHKGGWGGRAVSSHRAHSRHTVVRWADQDEPGGGHGTGMFPGTQASRWRSAPSPSGVSPPVGKPAPAARSPLTGLGMQPAPAAAVLAPAVIQRSRSGCQQRARQAQGLTSSESSS